MFESVDEVSVAEKIRLFAAELARIGPGSSDQERIEILGAAEDLKAATEGAQTVVTAALDESQRAAEAAAGVPAERRGRGVAAMVALARRVSPHRGRRLVGLARVLESEMPFTRAAMLSGRLSEWRATLLARETACLSLEDRRTVDERLAGDLDALERMGDRELVSAARELAYSLDPVSFVERRRRAEADRHVRLGPAPECMAQLGALLPVKGGVAVWATLSREADVRKAAGDPRSRGQIMADTLVERVVNPGADAAGGTGRAFGVPLMINVVVTDSILLGDEHGFGWVQDHGPVPGDLLREWIAANAEDGVEQWVRRLYATPSTGALVQMDSTARLFEGRLAEFLRLRDQRCRRPYCDAPVRHLDHVEDHAAGGVTSAANGQGLCEGCNHAKQALGWSERPRPGPRHTVETITPTGHRYTSVAPAMRFLDRRWLGLRIDFVLTA